MNDLEKIHALQAGEFDKVFEDGPYGDKSIYRHQTMVVYPYAGQHLAIKDGLANAAKVEVTKGVLPVIEAALEGASLRLEGSGMLGGMTDPVQHALTLLKTLRDTLKT